MNQKIKIALLGKGKTGGKVLELMIQNQIPHSVFDSTHLPTLNALKGHDVVISFLTGDVFKTYIPLLIETKIPVICGSTGIVFDQTLQNQIKDNNLKWIYATNFSLGMNLVHQMILILKEANRLFTDYSFNIHEVHHTKKLDAPSGTALSWKEWSGHDINITSERTGDVVGIHELTLHTPYENISIKHEALDRSIFAEGALFAAQKIITDQTIIPGLHLFQTIVQNELTKRSFT